MLLGLGLPLPKNLYVHGHVQLNGQKMSKSTGNVVDPGEIIKGYGLRVANVFHAGDGNLHPLILYNCNDPVEAQKAEDAGNDILKLCVEVGGCLTGEHGVGIEKRDLMRVQFTDTDLALQMRIKTVFDPEWLLNPAKVFPLELPREVPQAAE